MAREHPFPNRPAGIAHRMIGAGQGRKLNFFTAGFSDAGSSDEDFWTIRFREVSED